MSGGKAHETVPGARASSHARDDEPAAPGRWARLCVVSPRELAGVHPLPPALVLGREPGPGGLALPHGTVSRRHLELRVEDGLDAFAAADQGSRNGSWINAVPVGTVPRVLRSGDVVRLGEVVAVFEQGRGAPKHAGPDPRDVLAGDLEDPNDLRRADVLAWIDLLHGRLQATGEARSGARLDLSAEAVETLLLHEWPEGLRGLEHLVRALANRPDRGRITRVRLATWIGNSAAPPTIPLPGPPRHAMTTTAPMPAEPGGPRPPKPTREELVTMLEAHAWNLRAVARHYGRDRRQIYRWLDEFGLELRR